MSAVRLIVWRHGQTNWNLQGRWQGQVDIPLNETGIAQAAKAAPLLAEFSPDQIIASDLSRAKDTAGQLATLTGLEVQVEPRLREIAMGEWEGLTAEEIGEQAGEHKALEDAGHAPVRGNTGENVHEVADRVAEAFTDIVEAAEDGSTVVVAMHGLAARVGAFRFVGMPSSALGWTGPLDNCHWIVLDLDRAGRWRMAAYNSGRAL